MKHTKPFFARFLESQETLRPRDLEGIRGGARDSEYTMKFPSDMDESTPNNTNCPHNDDTQ